MRTNALGIAPTPQLQPRNAQYMHETCGAPIPKERKGETEESRSSAGRVRVLCSVCLMCNVSEPAQQMGVSRSCGQCRGKRKPGGITAGISEPANSLPPTRASPPGGTSSLPTSTLSPKSVKVCAVKSHFRYYILRSLQARVSAPPAVLVHLVHGGRG